MAKIQEVRRISDLEPGNYAHDKFEAMLPASIRSEETFKYGLWEAEEAADKRAEKRVADEAALREAADIAEAAERERQDALLQANIDTEARQRIAEDGKLSVRINQEASDRQAGDASLDAKKQDRLPVGYPMRLVKADWTFSTGYAEIIDKLDGKYGGLKQIPSYQGVPYLVLMSKDELKALIITADCSAPLYTIVGRQDKNQNFTHYSTSTIHAGWASMANGYDFYEFSVDIRKELYLIKARLDALET